MPALSPKAREALKTALAITLAYGISLRMGWEDPYWAGFAVAVISLSTVGQSLNKGAMRMLGTLVAAAASLALIAAFAQDRWWFVAVLSLYLGFCVYMVTGKRHVYFWWCCAFVVLVVCVHAAGGAEDAFQVAVLRVQQTGLGILVYSLVTVFLWPSSTRDRLHAAARDLVATQGEVFRAYRELSHGRGADEDSRPLRMREVQLVGQLEQALRGAETDSYEVAEMRRQWWRLHRECTALMETLAHWRESIPEVSTLDPRRLAPNLDAFYADLDARFAEIERVLAGERPGPAPEPVTLVVDDAAVGQLGHFEQAAVAVARSSVERIQVLTSAMLECVLDIAGHGGGRASEVDSRPVLRPGARGLDPDRLMAAGKTVAAVWIAFVVWFYVDPPGHASFVLLTVMYFMMAMMSRLDPVTIFKPMLVGALLGGILYIFVMPTLSGYAQLGTMIFLWVFAVGCFLGEPRQALAKTALTMMFMNVIAVQNEQTYSFVAFASTVLAMTLGAGALALAIYYLPPSPRPEKTFLRLLARFFRHSDHLLSRLALDRDRGSGLARCWAALFYQADLLELPQKLATWGGKINHAAFPDNSPEQVQALVNSLHALALRVKALGEARELPHAERLVRELSGDMRAWRLVVQDHLRRWGDDPSVAAGRSDELRDRLMSRLAELERRVEEVFESIGEGELRDEDYENIYRFLGSFRGLSEAGLGYARLAETVDWARLREERFT